MRGLVQLSAQGQRPRMHSRVSPLFQCFLFFLRFLRKWSTGLLFLVVACFDCWFVVFELCPLDLCCSISTEDLGLRLTDGAPLACGRVFMEPWRLVTAGSSGMSFFFLTGQVLCDGVPFSLLERLLVLWGRDECLLEGVPVFADDSHALISF